MAMAEAPQFNPLYLCSGPGQGKTPLLHAIAQGYAAVHPTAHILLMSAAKFLLEFVGALSGCAIIPFKARLRSSALLLIAYHPFAFGTTSPTAVLLHNTPDRKRQSSRLH